MTSSRTSAQALLEQPLAFSSDSSLHCASSRLAVETSHGAILNVEVFAFGAAPALLLVVPGICESAETKGVQAIVQGAKEHKYTGKIAVLELEGHGLSSGKRCVCPSFDDLVEQVVETVHQAAEKLFESDREVSIYLTGNSLGGAVVIYAAAKLATVKGLAPIAPAVGMDPRMLPPSVLVYGLRALAFVAPTLQVSLTPYEDSSHYNCPSTTNRNFQGNWPLVTSKMLLDATSQRIPNDIKDGNKLTLSHITSVLVIVGEKDQVVPLAAIESFHTTVQSPNKDILKLKRAGHDLLFQAKSSQQIGKALFEWIQNQEAKK